MKLIFFQNNHKKKTSAEQKEFAMDAAVGFFYHTFVAHCTGVGGVKKILLLEVFVNCVAAQWIGLSFLYCTLELHLKLFMPHGAKGLELRIDMTAKMPGCNVL
jgi:hypothetical protein